MGKNREVKEEILLPNVLGIYIRVSSLQQVNDERNLQQIKVGQEKAKELGWDFKIYDDSGKKERLGFEQLISDIENKNLSGVYTSDLDRISRDYKEVQKFINLINKTTLRLFISDVEHKF